MIPALFFDRLPDLLAAHPEVATECVCVVEVHAGPVARTIPDLVESGAIEVDEAPRGAEVLGRLIVLAKGGV